MTDVFQQINDFLLSALNSVNGFMGTMLVVVLGVTALWFTIATKGVQFRLIGDMLRLLVRDDDKAIKKGGGKHVSSFQAFMVSIASRVGTGNLAGVATAIVIGGPGAIFWMWVMALIGSANAFIESTLAQLYKIKGKDSFIGGPAYYISKGLKKKWFAVLFAVSIIVCFGFANNIVQSNTISLAYVTAFGVDPIVMSIALTVLTLLIIFGGIQRIAKFSSVVVPVMAVAYLIVSIVIIGLHIEKVPEVFMLIVQNAFGYGQVLGGGVGMAIMYGFQRGLFSNEAGEGSAPNVAATATTGHPVKQGLIQSLGVFTDTLLICSCTAFIILCSGVYGNGHSGIELTQDALSSQIGSFGATFIAIIILCFAFTSVIGNYYYGECNLYFLTRNSKVMFAYRVLVGMMVFVGGVATLDLAWGIMDFTLAIMATTNLVAILLLGKYAVRCLNDYMRQRKEGKNPMYRRSAIPEISKDTECWPD